MSTGMKKPKKRGRPKINKADHRKVVPIRLTDAERKLYSNLANANDQNLSEWIREALRNAIQPTGSDSVVTGAREGSGNI